MDIGYISYIGMPDGRVDLKVMCERLHGLRVPESLGPLKV